jgi:hypothetical protein
LSVVGDFLLACRWRVSPLEHPVLRLLAGVEADVDDLADFDPAYLPTRDKERALKALARQAARLEGLRLRLLAASGDVAQDRGARSAGEWLAGECHDDPRAGVRDQRVADTMARWDGVASALVEGG